jgi:hypothetical protein
MNCTVSDCGFEVKTMKSGLCEKHYTRLKRHGSVEHRERAANGEGGLSYHGYRRITLPGGRRVFEHVHVAEQALGRKLPKGAVVHHVNEIRTDNRPENLVICESAGYHALLHARLNALRATGDVNKRPCVHCKQYDSLENLVERSGGTSHIHRGCQRDYWIKCQISE